MGDIVGGLFGSKPKNVNTSQVIVPDWLDKRNQSLVKRAEAASNTPFKQYAGQRVADFNPDMERAFGLARSNVGKYDPLMQRTQQGVMDLFARAEGPTSQQIQSLMNPFTQNVIDTSRRKQLEQYGSQVADRNRRAGMVNAFGGSRMALEQATGEEKIRQELDDTQYRGLFDAFNQANTQFNRGTDVLAQGIGQGLQTAQQGQQMSMADMANLLKSGGVQMENNQAKLTDAYSRFVEERNYPYEQINFLSNILNPMTGNYKAGQTTAEQKGGGSGVLGAVTGIGSIIGGLFSDERVKENIEEVGELDNGLTVFKYNYKGDPRTQIGVMAQEVEKVNPNAVSEVGGIKMVDYEKAVKEPKTQKFADGGIVYPDFLSEMLRRETQAKQYSPMIGGSGPPSAPSTPESTGSKEILSFLGDQKSSDPNKTASIKSIGQKPVIATSGPLAGQEVMPTIGTPVDDMQQWGMNNIAAPIQNFFSSIGFAEGGQIKNPALIANMDLEQRLRNLDERYMTPQEDESALDALNRSAIGAVMKGVLKPSELLTEGAARLTARPSELAAAGKNQVKDNAKSDVLAEIKQRVPQPSGPRNEPPPPPSGAMPTGASLEQLLSKVQPLDINMLEERGRGGARNEPPPAPMQSAENQAQARNTQPQEELFVNVPVGRQQAPAPQQDTGDPINYALLNFGISMLTSDGDFTDALGRGLSSYAATKEKMYEREQARKAGEAASEQQQFDNMLAIQKMQNDRIKAEAYSRQIDSLKKSGGMTPYQAAQIQRQLARDDLDARYKQALMGKIAAETGQITSLTGMINPDISVEEPSAEDDFMRWLTSSAPPE